jgi:hypothetical protein
MNSIYKKISENKTLILLSAGAASLLAAYSLFKNQLNNEI